VTFDRLRVYEPQAIGLFFTPNKPIQIRAMDDDIAFNMAEVSDPGSVKSSFGRRVAIIGKKPVNHIQPPGKLCFLLPKRNFASQQILSMMGPSMAQVWASQGL
jgi:hypothetical protein